ncbi:MAG: sulfite exporter TauE/SafE family protein [Anaerolineae bacterium]
MNTLWLDLILGFAIGMSLGMLGGGGSILTVPALVYLVGQSPQAAVTTSLAIVGANSVMGALLHRTQGTLNWRVALVFGGTGMVASYAAAGLSKQFSPHLLMVVFALLMLLVALLLLRGRSAKSTDTETSIALWKVIAGGAGIGLVTGILGVGGGFLIVPALVMLIGLPMHHAVGTSLVIIAMNSAAGFLGHLSGITIDGTVMTAFVAAGIVGTFVGVRFGKRLNPVILRRAFAIFVIILALFLLYDNFPKLIADTVVSSNPLSLTVA